MFGSLVIISCVAASVTIPVISVSFIVTGVSCVFFDPCIAVVVGSGDVGGVVGPAVVVFDTIQYIELVLILTALIVDFLPCAHVTLQFCNQMSIILYIL